MELIALLFLLIPGTILYLLASYPRRKQKKDMQFLLDRKILEIEKKYKNKEISKETYLRLIQDALDTYK